MKEGYRPRPLRLKNWRMIRTIVRELIPRNPKLDRPLVQTCCFFERDNNPSSLQAERSNHQSPIHGPYQQNGMDEGTTIEPINGGESSGDVVIYVPHVERLDEIPYYHPRVQALAFLYNYSGKCPEVIDEVADTSSEQEGGTGLLSIYSAPFPAQPERSSQPRSITHQESARPKHDERLQRTFNNLLNTIHRHGTGCLQGYTKRVHHDLVIPQRRFQNTYTRTKVKYASHVAQNWREVTDPTKHVFEDLGIAAWLMELWRDMYGIDPEATRETKFDQAKQVGFEGFVDAGCGNGLLVALLLWEDYEGWGFDVRRRKSWALFEEDSRVVGKLKERIMVPAVFSRQNKARTPSETHDGKGEGVLVHDGIFPAGKFIISNHADELTPWTPLMAYISHDAPFLAIPCCSHDLSGMRTRFPPQKPKKDSPEGEKANPSPSAYQTLCDYTERLSIDIGYDTYREYLRIPSTRNVGILGVPQTFQWKSKSASDAASPSKEPTDSSQSIDEGIDFVRGIVETELKTRGINEASSAWLGRAEKLSTMKGELGH